MDLIELKTKCAQVASADVRKLTAAIAKWSKTSEVDLAAVFTSRQHWGVLTPARVMLVIDKLNQSVMEPRRDCMGNPLQPRCWLCPKQERTAGRHRFTRSHVLRLIEAIVTGVVGVHGPYVIQAWANGIAEHRECGPLQWVADFDGLRYEHDLPFTVLSVYSQGEEDDLNNLPPITRSIGFVDLPVPLMTQVGRGFSRRRREPTHPAAPRWTTRPLMIEKAAMHLTSKPTLDVALPDLFPKSYFISSFKQPASIIPSIRMNEAEAARLVKADGSVDLEALLACDPELAASCAASGIDPAGDPSEAPTYTGP